MLDLFSHIFPHRRANHDHRLPGGHALGAIPDSYDERDHVYSIMPELFRLPPSVDLRRYCSPVRDQGQLGSCTGFAITALREYIELIGGNPLTVLSPLFLYYEERSLEGTVGIDAGAMIRDGMKVLANQGVAPEADEPYDPAAFEASPSAQALLDAPAYKVASYERVPTFLHLKRALTTSQPAILGFLVFESFETATGGRIPVPSRFERLLGGHAVLAVGYQDDKSAPGGGWVVFKNSWGTGWGDQGYGYLPYRYVESVKLTSDIWTASPAPVQTPGTTEAEAPKAKEAPAL